MNVFIIMTAKYVDLATLTCNFCGTVGFSSKQAFSVHQRRNKKCLDIQRQNNTEITDDLYECEYCQKKVSPYQVERHHGVCKVKAELDAQTKKDVVEELTHKLAEEIAHVEQLTVTIEEFSTAIEILDAKVTKYRKYYKKYLALKNRSEIKIQTAEISVQTDPDKEADSSPEIIKNIQTELATLKAIPSSSKMTKKTKEVQERIKELEADLETYQNQVVAIETKNIHGDSALWIDGVTIEARAFDGYINATQMCSSVKTIHGNDKEIKHWRANASSKAFLLELAAVVGIPTTALVLVGKSKFGAGGKEIETTPTWVHPRVAIHIAQWLSPKYAVRVTGWIMELHVRGTVTLGHEHTDAENMEVYKEQLAEANEKVDKLNEKCYQLEVKYAKTQEKVSYPKFTKTKCLYIWKNPHITDVDKIVYKVGIASDINSRLSTYRTGATVIELKFLVYTEINEELELAIKNTYSDPDPDKSNRKLKNHEFYYDNHIHPDILSELSRFIVSYLTIRRNIFEVEPDLSKYNRFMHDLAA